MPADAPPEQLIIESDGDTAESLAMAQGRVPPAPPKVIICHVQRQKMMGELESATHVLRMALVPGQQALLTVGADVHVWTFLNREQLEEVSHPSMVAQTITIGTVATLAVAGILMGGMPLGGAPGRPTGELQSDLVQFPVIPTTVSLRYSCVRLPPFHRMAGP